MTREELITSHLDLVYWVVDRQYVAKYPGKYQRDELVSHGMLALVNAANSFNPDLGYRFSTYASRSIVNIINREIMLAARRGFVGIFVDENPPATLSITTYPRDGRKWGPGEVSSDCVSDVYSDPVKKTITQFKIANLLGSLTERQRKVLTMHFLEGVTMKDIGKSMGVTRQTVDKIAKRSIRKLQKQFCMEES